MDQLSRFIGHGLNKNIYRGNFSCGETEVAKGNKCEAICVSRPAEHEVTNELRLRI